MRFPPLKRLRSAALAALLASAAVLFWGCLFGGTGTDTENGVTGVIGPDNTVQFKGVLVRVADAGGTPLKGVTLRLYLPGYRPDSGAAPDSLVHDAKDLISDTAGFVTINLKAAGKFVIEGLASGQTVFYDTLAVPDVLSSTLFTFRTRTVRSFKGKVKLASGMRIDSGAVFLRGTARWARLGAAGDYDLGSLPEDVDRMALGLRFNSSPTSVQEVTEIFTPDTGKSTFTCKDVPKDSSARIAETPSYQEVGATAAPKLDTSKVNSALKSCDTLPKGSVINVVPTGAANKRDSAGVPLLVVQNSVPVSAVNGTHLNAALVVPYAECVPSAGREKTSFEAQILAMGDILVKDVADKCLAP